MQRNIQVIQVCVKIWIIDFHHRQSPKSALLGPGDRVEGTELNKTQPRVLKASGSAPGTAFSQDSGHSLQSWIRVLRICVIPNQTAPRVLDSVAKCWVIELAVPLKHKKLKRSNVLKDHSLLPCFQHLSSKVSVSQTFYLRWCRQEIAWWNEVVQYLESGPHFRRLRQIAGAITAWIPRKRKVTPVARFLSNHPVSFLLR